MEAKRDRSEKHNSDTHRLIRLTNIPVDLDSSANPCFSIKDILSSLTRSFYTHTAPTITTVAVGINAFGYRLFQVQRKRITPAIPMSNSICYSRTQLSTTSEGSKTNRCFLPQSEEREL
ncbi:unnamed protein product [Lactuca virosa]|uniref:Uncharacterized protein n=1 Tax=Lactuca virosa TaxID=75947 RepID=A0AAU9M0Z5_9ASTR|nr:unnamed protein product [Lactuca virosa]